MKPGARLINASRGTVVDIDALAEALRVQAHVRAPRSTCFPQSRKAPGMSFVSPLRGMDNVLLTPHIGGSTEEAQQNIGVEVAEKLIKYSNNGSTLAAVNFPEVSLPEHPGKHRLLHIHRNQPGVLSADQRDFLGTRRSTSRAQYLQTNASIGYVVIDVETASVRPPFRLRTSWTKCRGPSARGCCIKLRHGRTHRRSSALLASWPVPVSVDATAPFSAMP